MEKEQKYELITEEQAKKELTKREKKADELIKKPSKCMEVLEKLEKECDKLPKAFKSLKYVPALISCARAYIKKEYREIPYGTIVHIVAALLYLASPVDIIPDVIPVIGHGDDAIVIALCLKGVKEDLDKYIIWRDGMETVEAK